MPETPALTRPETAYDLLQEVCDSIEASPENYNQGVWANRANQYHKDACGTAFCRAGWMCAVLDQGKGRTTEDWIMAGTAIGRISTYEMPEIRTRGHKILAAAGIPAADVYALFDGDAAGPSRNAKAHAKRGVAGLKKFMALHADKLKSYRIKETD